MRTQECWECGVETEDLHDHHIIPRSRGGMKTVPLCTSCHGKAHHLKKNMAISSLTREGLARAKARGVKLGNSNWEPALEKAKHVRQSNADEFARQLGPVIDDLRNRALVQTFAELASALNRLGYKTRRNNQFHGSTARKLERRWLRIMTIETNTEESEQ
jgi:hypothetical protein